MLIKYQEQPNVDEKLIFVLMSNNSNNKQLEDYYRAMQRAVKRVDQSYTCVNIIETNGSFKISETVLKKIQNCRLAIIDLTEKKPNVYYELGFVHGIRKDFILTAQSQSEILFYPNEYRIIKYKNASELEEKLHKQLSAVMKLAI